MAANCSEALEAKAALFRLKISSSLLLLLSLLMSLADMDEANDLECNLLVFLFLGGLTFILPCTGLSSLFKLATSVLINLEGVFLFDSFNFRSIMSTSPLLLLLFVSLKMSSSSLLVSELRLEF